MRELLEEYGGVLMGCISCGVILAAFSMVFNDHLKQIMPPVEQSMWKPEIIQTVMNTQNED